MNYYLCRVWRVRCDLAKMTVEVTVGFFFYVDGLKSRHLSALRMMRKECQPRRKKKINGVLAPLIVTQSHLHCTLSRFLSISLLSFSNLFLTDRY